MSMKMVLVHCLGLLLLASLPLISCVSGEQQSEDQQAGDQQLGRIEDNRVIFDKSELTINNDDGVLLNLVATNGHVGIRFYKDFGFGNEQETNPWHMGYIEGLTGYEGLAILRDWLFTAALWDEEGRLTVGRLDPYPPGNQPAHSRFEVRGTVDEVQAMVVAPKPQTSDIFQIVGVEETAVNEFTPTDMTEYFTIDGHGNTVIGSSDEPTQVILYDTADGTPYSLQITNGELVITQVVDGEQ
jgi:hypothetical protein